MKVRAVPRRPLTKSEAAPAAGTVVPTEPSDAPIEAKKERLYRAIERAQAFMHRESPEAAMALIRRHYPSPTYFLESSCEALTRLGLNHLDAFYYALIPDLTRTGLSQQWGAKPRLDALSRMAAYVRTLYVGAHVECSYLILLDGRGRLIRPVLLQRGGVDSAPFYLRPMMAAALEEEARYIALAHNHPGGTKHPSKEDLLCTLKALSAFAPLRIPLLDHLIVAGRDVVSIRQSSLIAAMLWTAPFPDSRVVRGWLDTDLLY